MKSTTKQLWLVFGPLLLAIVLCGAFFAYPWSGHRSPAIIQKAAVSLNNNVFKNQNIKTQAFAQRNPKYIPVFGSSELSRMDKYHPATLANKYHNYRLFLFGSRGTQSLPQLFNLATMEPQMKHRKAVMIISPQWFVKPGIERNAFTYYTGTYSDVYWLLAANPQSKYDQYTAQRLIQLTNPTGTLGSGAKRIAQGKALSAWQRNVLTIQKRLLANQDRIFSGHFLTPRYENRIKPGMAALPITYNYDQLKHQAAIDKARASTNNQLGVVNSFYNRQIKGHLKESRGTQKHFSYLQSPEYGDLEVVLNQFAKLHMDVLFVITPVNEKWEQQTGLNMSMYYQTVNKIKYQLQQQGFNNIVDYSHKGNDPSFMNDTIHLGWVGWVDLDQKINTFVNQTTPTPTYRMNDQFLTPTWANLIPTSQHLTNFTKRLH